MEELTSTDLFRCKIALLGTINRLQERVVLEPDEISIPGVIRGFEETLAKLNQLIKEEIKQ
jgi:hypothetical protein